MQLGGGERASHQPGYVVYAKHLKMAAPSAALYLRVYSYYSFQNQGDPCLHSVGVYKSKLYNNESQSELNCTLKQSLLYRFISITDHKINKIKLRHVTAVIHSIKNTR